jgi:hypothetical protein
VPDFSFDIFLLEELYFFAASATSEGDNFPPLENQTEELNDRETAFAEKRREGTQ